MSSTLDYSKFKSVFVDIFAQDTSLNGALWADRWGSASQFTFDSSGLTLTSTAASGWAPVGFMQAPTGKGAGEGYGLYQFTGYANAGQGTGIGFIMWRADNLALDPSQPNVATEIDVLESWDGTKTGESTIHYYNASWVGGNGQEWNALPQSIDLTKVHTYAMDWERGSLTYYVDGVEIYQDTTHAPLDYADGGSNEVMGAELINMSTVVKTSTVQLHITEMEYSAPIASTTPIATIPTPAAPVPTTVDGLTTVTLHGSHDQYIIACTQDGSLYIQDTVANRDGTQTIAKAGDIVFADGTGRFDSSGQAEEVARLYRAAFNRLPDAGGLDYWAAQETDSHITATNVATAFATSTEFETLYGSLSDDGFVQQLYHNVLGRAADSAGLQFWDGAMAQGTTRGAVLLGFSNSAENQANTLSFSGDPSEAEAYRVYQAALDRAPDASGLQFWSDVLAGGTSEQNVAAGFVGSAEFTSKYGALDNNAFVQQLYENVLHRAGDASGVQFWTDSLNVGQTRAAVLTGFAESSENRVNTAPTTHDGWVFLG